MTLVTFYDKKLSLLFIGAENAEFIYNTLVSPEADKKEYDALFALSSLFNLKISQSQ